LGSRLDTKLRVQVREGLIHQEYLGFANDGASHGDPLALPTRESFGLAIEVGLEIQQLGCVLNAGGTVLFANTGDLQRKPHVFCHGHVGVEGIVLEDHRDIAVFRRDIGDISVTDEDAPIIDFFESCEHSQRRGLSAARRPDENKELAIFDPEVERIHCGGGCSGIDTTCFVKRHRRHDFLLHRQVRAGRSFVNGTHHAHVGLVLAPVCQHLPSGHQFFPLEPWASPG